MINHVRTLLLNRRAADMVDVTGYEYIAPEYQPIALDNSLTRIRNVLYPSSLDAFGQHEVTANLVQLIHQPELCGITAEFDPRFTYKLDDDRIAKALTNPITVTRNKSSECDITIHTRLQPPVKAGIKPGLHTWRISTGDSDTVSIQYGKDTPVLHSITSRRTALTDYITLVPDYLSVYFDIPSGSLTGTYQYTLSLIVSARYNFADILTQLTRELAVPGQVSALFTQRAGLPDVQRLMQTWQSSPEMFIRVGAVVLAFAVQLHYATEVRGG